MLLGLYTLFSSDVYMLNETNAKENNMFMIEIISSVNLRLNSNVHVARN